MDIKKTCKQVKKKKQRILFKNSVMLKWNGFNKENIWISPYQGRYPVVPGSDSLYSGTETSQAASWEDTKGLNLLCDTGFPLGSHKRRTERPRISLFQIYYHYSNA